MVEQLARELSEALIKSQYGQALIEAKKAYDADDEAKQLLQDYVNKQNAFQNKPQAAGRSMLPESRKIIGREGRAGKRALQQGANLLLQNIQKPIPLILLIFQKSGGGGDIGRTSDGEKTTPHQIAGGPIAFVFLHL